MIFKETTYRTLSGPKKIIQLRRKKSTQWVVYKDDKPAYFVDLYDLQKESNAMMNSLVLCAKRPMKEALELINKKNNINLSVPKTPCLIFNKKIKSELIELNLDTIPEEWLAYSL
tara:strand:+ start:13677 stop:14021 length:345 start_codon:yes stop_codon:yes gene_type:complete